MGTYGIRDMKHFLALYYQATRSRQLMAARLRDTQATYRPGDAAGEKIAAHIATEDRAATEVMAAILDVIAVLPAESLERAIMEMRHIEFKSWTAIQRAVNLSPSACYSYYRKGLKVLLRTAEAVEAMESMLTQAETADAGSGTETEPAAETEATEDSSSDRDRGDRAQQH